MVSAPPDSSKRSWGAVEPPLGTTAIEYEMCVSSFCPNLRAVLLAINVLPHPGFPIKHQISDSSGVYAFNSSVKLMGSISIVLLAILLSYAISLYVVSSLLFIALGLSLSIVSSTNTCAKLTESSFPRIFLTCLFCISRNFLKPDIQFLNSFTKLAIT